MKNMTKSVFVAILLLGCFLTAGCENTIAGFGKDMQKTGQEIQKSTR